MGCVGCLNGVRRVFELDTSVYWTGRPDRSPLHFLECFVYGVRRFYQFVKMSNEPSENAHGCAKIRIGDRERNFQAVCEIHIDRVSVGFFSFCLLSPSIRSLPSAFSHGRTQFHISGIMPLWSLKNENRWLFSYGRTTTTVRTRPYDGSRSSVRSQSQVLSTVEMGSANAFFALETV